MKKKNKNTPYDDVFRTLLEKSTGFVIPVINEIFKTSYPMTEDICLVANEHFTSVKGGHKKRITDSQIKIQNHYYHLECESKSKDIIVLRMIEYDFETAFSHQRKEHGEYFLDFPYSAVIFLRRAASIPKFMTVNISFPDGQKVKYKLPSIKVQEYTKDEIFEKQLYFFIPYYIMRYEKQISDIDKNEEKLKELVEDYEDIYERLSVLEKNEVIQEDYLYNLIELTDMLIDVVAEEADNVRREVKYMGGRVLKLKSDKIVRKIQKERDKGRAKGRAEGRVEGRRIGIRESEKRNFRLVTILLKEKKYDELEEAAKNEDYRNELYEKYQIEIPKLHGDK